MDQDQLQKALSTLPLGSIRYFDRIDSTNSEAARWAQEGAPAQALVVADEQTAGRGRLGRRWHTPPGAALAFSLVLRAEPGKPFSAPALPHLTALGALAVAQGLQEQYALPAEIKWPNDVLVERRKLAGILAEAHWRGDRLETVILGIGINVASPSVPPLAELNFPATCVEAHWNPASDPTKRVNRLVLLRAVLSALLEWRSRLGSPEFIQAWESRLAFLGEWVYVFQDFRKKGLTEVPAAGQVEPASTDIAMEGQVLGLAQDGSLRLRTRSGEEILVQVGEIHLRPAERNSS